MSKITVPELPSEHQEHVKMVEKLKVVLREEEYPLFSDDELMFYLKDNGFDFNDTAHQCLLIKSESTALVMSGFEISESSKYFRRLAQRYRRTNSRVL